MINPKIIKLFLLQMFFAIILKVEEINTFD